MRNYQETIRTRKDKYANFDESALAPEFIPYFNSQERIKVQFEYGEIKTGTVGITTGWKPCFLLMLTKRSIGSSWGLSSKDTIIGVKKKGGKYETSASR